jgi:5-methylcytosine-specific restriction endonuclease McrA
MKQPCIDCGRPSDATRCPTHAAEHATRTNARQTTLRRSRGRRTYNSRGYRDASAAVRATATRCWICGEGPRRDDPWQADHVIPVKDAGGTGPLAAAHRSCNVGRSNRLRAGKADPALTPNGRRLSNLAGGSATTESNPNANERTSTGLRSYDASPTGTPPTHSEHGDGDRPGSQRTTRAASQALHPGPRARPPAGGHSPHPPSKLHERWEQ